MLQYLWLRVRKPEIFLWLAPPILMAPVWATGRALFWGTPLLQFIPWWAYAWETLLSGHLPLWNPYVGMGAPLAANYQSALFYPGTWVYFGLFLVGGVRWMAWGQAVMIAVHLVWSACGMARLAAHLGLGRFAQVVAGLAFGLSGYLAARASFLSINAAAAWLPWIVLCMTVLVDALQSNSRVRRAFLLLSLCVTFQLLAGHAQTTWYTMLLTGAWGVFYALSRRFDAEPFRLAIRAAVGYGAAVLLAVLTAAVQLLPTAEYLAQSQRSAAVAYDYALTYSFWPWRLLSFLAPTIFGSPVSGDYWGYGNYWEDAVYIGLVPLLLALAVVIGVIRRRNRAAAGGDSSRALIIFLAVVILIAFLFALGSNTPVYPWLYRNFPTFDMFQAPTRWTLAAEFALALLAGYGAQMWARPNGRGLYWTRLGAMGAVAVLIGAGVGWLILGSVSPTFVRAAAMFGLWSFGAALLSLKAPERRMTGEQASGQQVVRWSRWNTAAAGWIALDLLIAGWGLNPAGPLDLYAASPSAAEVSRIAKGGRLYIPPAEEREIKYKRFLVFDTFDPGEDWINLRRVNLANANMLDRLPTANQYDPLTPAAYAAWMEMLESASVQQEAGLLRLMDVGVVERIAAGVDPGVTWTAVERGGRVGVAPCARWVKNFAEAQKMLLESDPAAAGIIYLSRMPGAPDDPGCQPAAAWLKYPPTVKLTTDGYQTDPDRLVIEVDLPAAGWVWVADTWYPGWRATIDGEHKAIAQANGLFRAVPVEPGAHRIVMEYRPVSFLAGAALSLIGLVILVIGWWRSETR